MASETRVVVENFYPTDRLWIVIPLWDEGEDWEAAEGTASLVIAPTQKAAEELLRDADWTRIFELPARKAFDE